MSEKERTGKVSEVCNAIYKELLGEMKSNVIAYQMTRKTAEPIIERICKDFEKDFKVNPSSICKILYAL